MAKNLHAHGLAHLAVGPTRKRARERGVSLSPSIISGLVVVADSFAALLAAHLVYFLYVGWSPESHPIYLTAMIISTAMMIAVFHQSGLYSFDSISHLPHKLGSILILTALVFLILVGLAFALKISSNYSRVWLFGSMAATQAMICALRASVYFALHSLAKSGRLTRNLAIVGRGPQADALFQHLAHRAEPWLRVVGFFDDRMADRDGGEDDPGVVGSLDNLIDMARAQRVDDIIIALPWSAEQRISRITEKLLQIPAHIHLAPDLVLFRYAGRAPSIIGDLSMLEISAKPIAGWQNVAKEIEDRVLSLVLLAAFSPLMLFIAMLIKFSGDGPVLFKQRRYGLNNRVISIYKFRTMRDDESEATIALPARPGDDRVSRVGRILRRSGLDELPQLFNVAMGNMSLIGPRPLLIEHNERYAPLIRGYFARHRVKPGITGWAQVNGFRSNTHTEETMKARVAHDLYYIENWSLFFDFKIIVMTLFAMISGRNAH